MIHAFVWRDGRGWITCGVHRHRVSAIRRDPRCSLVVSGIAAPDGPNGAITIKGRAIIHDDQETKDWFYPALARGPYGAGGANRTLTPEEEAGAKGLRNGSIHRSGSLSRSCPKSGSLWTAKKWLPIPWGNSAMKSAGPRLKQTQTNAGGTEKARHRITQPDLHR